LGVPAKSRQAFRSNLFAVLRLPFGSPEINPGQAAQDDSSASGKKDFHCNPSRGVISG